MKCNKILVYGWKSEKSKTSGKPSQLLAYFTVVDKVKERLPKSYIIDRMEACKGKIKSNIEIEYQGNFEGDALFSDAGINVEFKCTWCGSTDFPKLPRSLDELNKFLTERIEEI